MDRAKECKLLVFFFRFASQLHTVVLFLSKSLPQQKQVTRHEIFNEFPVENALKCLLPANDVQWMMHENIVDCCSISFCLFCW